MKRWKDVVNRTTTTTTKLSWAKNKFIVSIDVNTKESKKDESKRWKERKVNKREAKIKFE